SDLGYPAEGSAAHFTSGGSEANLTATVAALTAKIPAYADSGVVGLGAMPTLYVSEEAHDSFSKIARVIGIGRRAVRKVPVDNKGRLQITALTAAIDSDRKAGFKPFMVVGTVGTTALGAIDP